jgi:hypothetical protein
MGDLRDIEMGATLSVSMRCARASRSARMKLENDDPLCSNSLRTLRGEIPWRRAIISVDRSLRSSAWRMSDLMAESRAAVALRCRAISA